MDACLHLWGSNKQYQGEILLNLPKLDFIKEQPTEANTSPILIARIAELYLDVRGDLTVESQTLDVPDMQILRERRAAEPTGIQLIEYLINAQDGNLKELLLKAEIGNNSVDKLIDELPASPFREDHFIGLKSHALTSCLTVVDDIDSRFPQPDRPFSEFNYGATQKLRLLKLDPSKWRGSLKSLNKNPSLVNPLWA